ncbi:MAG: hypothetical protein JO144_11710 [Actinobacteria bacterium]|nr:hypothetical protein [Actinomycetota bacterium]
MTTTAAVRTGRIRAAVAAVATACAAALYGSYLPHPQPTASVVSTAAGSTPGSSSGSSRASTASAERWSLPSR